MKILIACEFSGEVRDAFIARGHDAISCDILPTEKPGPHYQGDVRDILNDNWDMIIAFPPCTYLANMGAVHFYLGRKKINGMNIERLEKMREAADFFNLFLKHSCPRICIENPIHIGLARKLIKKYDQIIHPFQFGHTATKATCLWLKGLLPLVPSNIVGKGIPYVNPKDGISRGSFVMKIGGSDIDKKIKRSRTFPGIAEAMATQWG